MVSPIFFIFLLLSVRLISCDALCHVVLEVLVEERVVVFIEAGRADGTLQNTTSPRHTARNRHQVSHSHQDSL